jgi:MoaA/NifB/PqqE/SkfB family radical SAM enzyme
MTYDAIVAKAVDRNIPLSVLLELTYACELDCFYCYNDRATAGRPLTVAQYETLFAELRDLGTATLTFSGGEPLAHRDVFALGARAREMRFVVRVKTSGNRLTEPLARRLRDEVDPFVVEVSLHGASAATHDRQTRVPGSHARLLANLEAMVGLGLRVQLNATLTAWNEEEIEPMCDLAERLGLLLRWNTQISPRDDGDASPLALAASPGAIRRLQAARDRRRPVAEPAAAPPVRWSKYCGAAASGLTVDPWGNVYPCVQWRVPSGNLHEESVREIWERSPALLAVRVRTEALAVERFAGSGVSGERTCPALSGAASGDGRRWPLSPARSSE